MILTASKTFYDKGMNPRQLVYRGESFLVSDVKGKELIRAGLARAGQDYETKIIEPERKEDPKEPVKEQPEEETKEPDPTAEAEPLHEMTVKQLKELLRARGISYDSDAKKADLIELLSR